MSKPILTYFDFSGSRGEECRMALFVAGVDFEDNRIKGETWPDLKPTTPYGCLPTLEINGRMIGQSNAILTLIGTQHGLLPEDPIEAAQHLAILSAVEDLRGMIVPTMREKDEDKKKATREELSKGFLTTWAKQISALMGEGPFLAGENISIADIKLYMAIRWIVSGVLDYISPATFTDHPKLMQLHQAVGDHPKIAEWIARG